jgi:hypothetical protein
MKCGFTNKDKECNIRCEYYHTCTRSEYNKKESREHGGSKVDKTKRRNV